MAGDGAEPLVLSLRQIFSQASILVTLAGLTEAERNRDIAFYDETLLVNIRLSIPSSDKTLPAPLSSSSTSFTLPIDTEAGDEGADDDEPRDAPPRLLLLLLSSMQVILNASYTAPRLSDPPATGKDSVIGSKEASLVSNHVAPASSKRDAAYQNIALLESGPNGEVTRMFSNTWNACDIPMEDGEAIDVIISHEEDNKVVSNGGEISYAEKNGTGTWITDWRCRLPVTFVRSRHPTPALLLTAGMTLRLQPSSLARLAPSLISNLDSSTASESVFMHDLLNPLSEGPSYPDESPAERAARADASLAKLPLGRLPSSILGSKLVTPARNAKEVGLLAAKRIRLENGDMGETKENSKKDHRRVLTNEGLMAYHVGTEGSLEALNKEQVKGLGEDVVILQRSARKVLDVRSAIMVRMRTVTVPDFNSKDGYSDASLLPTMILCVEVENPLNSGMEYALDKAEVTVLTPTGSISQVATSKESVSFHVSMLRIGEPIEPLNVKQGSQFNLLYRAEFEIDMNNDEDDHEALMACLGDTLRNVSIKLLGRPIFATDENLAVSSPIGRFTSTWTCTLDMAPQMRMLALRRVIENGAGCSALRGPSKNDRKLLRKRVASTSALKLQRPPSPNSSRPRTPTQPADQTNRSPFDLFSTCTSIIAFLQP